MTKKLQSEVQWLKILSFTPSTFYLEGSMHSPELLRHPLDPYGYQRGDSVPVRTERDEHGHPHLVIAMDLLTPVAKRRAQHAA
ncbi:MAG: hypothetical protein JWM56_444 [Candidatus Peribacteria bacterium]|nr:hypothetical protein [Candidatus Peribacteria bacterium]